MLDFVRDGDTIYIHDLSRLARSTKDLLDIVEKLNAKGVHLVINKENIDSSTPTGKLMLTMIGAIAEFERQNLLERQREGIAIAKREGKFKGGQVKEDFMKKILLFLIISILLASCNNDKNAIIASLEAENQQLKSQIGTDQSVDNSETITETTISENIETKKSSDEEIAKYIEQDISFNGFNSLKDDFEEATFIMYSSISTLKSSDLRSEEPLYAYIVLHDTDDVTLHLVGKYKGSKWIFFNKAQLKGEDEVFTLFENVSSYDKKEDIIDGGNVLESYDLRPVNNNIIESLENLNHEQSYKLRFSGDDYYYEYNVTPTMIDAIQKTINLYKTIEKVLHNRIVPESIIVEASKPQKPDTKSSEFYVDVQSIGGRFAPAKYINVNNDSLAFVISQTWDDKNLYKYSEIGTGDTSSRKFTAKFENDKLILTSNDGYDVSIICYSDGKAICTKNGVEQSYENEKKLEFMRNKESLSEENTEESLVEESQEQDSDKDGIEVLSTYVGQNTTSLDRKVTVKLINHTGKKIKSIEYILRAYATSLVYGRNVEPGQQAYSERDTYEFSNPLEIEKKSQINIDIFSADVHPGDKIEFEILRYTYAE